MKYFCVIILFFLNLSLSAQTTNNLAQAKLDYKNKEYSKALPVFEQEYNTKPNDPSLNLWYGVCLVETKGDLKKAEECLLLASKKNLPEAFLFLGDIYTKEYRVNEAQTLYDRFAKLRPREKALLTERQEYLDELEKNIARTEKIQIIDSVIVDKSNLLLAYNLSNDLGELVEYKYMFNAPDRTESTIYVNGTKSKMYFGEEVQGKSTLFSMEKLINGEYGNKKKITNDNFGLSGNINYPFVMADGMTIYFAAEDQNGMGGYDIYVTRYNLNNNTYLTPEKLNMPFNSTANDYLMVIDENKGIGWFATDRFQPEGKVCIYTFIPNEDVSLLESDDEVYLQNRAKIASIRDTQIKGKNYSPLRQLAKQEYKKKVEKAKDFVFVINDNYTYYTNNDFKSVSARNIYSEANQKRNLLENIEKELDSQRNLYLKTSSIQSQEEIATAILNLEKQQSELYRDIKDLETKARSEEIKALQ